MTLLEYLEKDKERLLSGLVEAGTPERATAVIEKEVDRLLLLYNEDCQHTAIREAAACMLQAVRLSSPLVNTNGKIKVWETSQTKANGKQKKVTFLEVLFLALAAAAMIGAFVVALQADPGQYRPTDIVLAVLLSLAAPALAWFAGIKAPGKIVVAEKSNPEYHTEMKVDALRIYTALHNTVYAIDQNLSYIPTGADGVQAGGAEVAGGLTAGEIDLMAGLLEAAYSEDGVYALDKLADVKLFLHRKQIEAVDFNGENEALFDFMPSGERKTIRPALVSEGIVVKRGLATGR